MNEQSHARLLVVGVHGRPGNRHSLREIEQWAERRNLPFASYDQYGVDADVPPVSNDVLFDHLLDELTRFTQRCDPAASLLLWGHSFGAMLCAHLMARSSEAPGRIAGAVLSGFCPFREEFVEYNASRLEKRREEFDRLHLCRMEPWPDYFARSMRSVPHGDITLAPRYDDVLSRITQPVLLLRGEHDICSGRQQELVMSHVAVAQAACIDGASHYMFIEQPAATFAAVDGFVDRLPAARAG